MTPEVSRYLGPVIAWVMAQPHGDAYGWWIERAKQQEQIRAAGLRATTVEDLPAWIRALDPAWTAAYITKRDAARQTNAALPDADTENESERRDEQS